MGLYADAKNIQRKDPAARNVLEVMLLYPGWHALVLHRPAHWLYNLICFFLARFISQLARKGSQVYVEGEFRTRSYEAEGTGEKRYVSEIWARDFRLLGRKTESSSAPLPTSPDDFGSQPAPVSATSPAQPAQAAPQQPAQGTLNLKDEQDDLPF